MKNVRLELLALLGFICLTGCVNTKIPDSDIPLLSNIQTNTASAVVREKYRNVPDFAWYWRGKHLVGHRFSSHIAIYGVVDEDNVLECIKIYRERIVGAPAWYRVYLEFYEKENMIKHTNGASRGEEQLILKVTLAPPK